MYSSLIENNNTFIHSLIFRLQVLRIIRPGRHLHCGLKMYHFEFFSLARDLERLCAMPNQVPSAGFLMLSIIRWFILASVLPDSTKRRISIRAVIRTSMPMSAQISKANCGSGCPSSLLFCAWRISLSFIPNFSAIFDARSTFEFPDNKTTLSKN